MRRNIWLIILASLFQVCSLFGQSPITVAGTGSDFMIVNHYVLKGTNKEIGKQLARIAKDLHVKPNSVTDTVRNKLRYKYFKENYPAHYERMKGAAEEYGLRINDYTVDLSSFKYFPSKASCAVVYYPGDKTESKHNIISRNMDMPIDIDVNGAHPYSRPVIFQVYPDTGYASIYICLNDLLGGAAEGINSKGLCVAVLGDETANYNCHPGEPSFETGLNELLIMRYLLDNCANTDEAEESLLWLKQYYSNFQLHYMIGDSRGKSFVFEFSRHRNQSHIVEGNGIQCVTNHSLSSQDKSNPQPESLERLGILEANITGNNNFTLDQIKEINSKVSPWMTGYKPVWPSSRTLWHSVYDLDSKTLNVKFYMGETKDPADGNKIIAKYSDYIEFKLMKEIYK